MVCIAPVTYTLAPPAKHTGRVGLVGLPLSQLAGYLHSGLVLLDRAGIDVYDVFEPGVRFSDTRTWTAAAKDQLFLEPREKGKPP
jgi:hypothetical protein